MAHYGRITGKLSAATHALILGVGGGNDSVTALLLREQLRLRYFRPGRIDIAAMLPDCLDYRSYQETGLPNVWKITPETERWVQGIRVTGFPEPILARAAERFGIGHIWGLDMRNGSAGIAEALAALIRKQSYDFILACDIGGDFIAAAENHEVLSPMMDGYALDALRRLQMTGPEVIMVGAVFGLGTDGESSPEMLRRALENIGGTAQAEFRADIAPEVETFYREEIEPNRYSRTADFTLQEIRQVNLHGTVENYRVRYHSRPDSRKRRSYTGEFDHTFDPVFYGKYYLFDDLSGIANPFAVDCENAVDWLVKITAGACGRERVHHEMVGQRVLYQGAEVLFAVPSRKFSDADRRSIFADTMASIRNGVYDAAFVYTEDVGLADDLSDLSLSSVNAHLSLIQRPDGGGLLAGVV